MAFSLGVESERSQADALLLQNVGRHSLDYTAVRSNHVTTAVTAANPEGANRCSVPFPCLELQHLVQVTAHVHLKADSY
jgi:hypothetical protein